MNWRYPIEQRYFTIADNEVRLAGLKQKFQKGLTAIVCEHVNLVQMKIVHVSC